MKKPQNTLTEEEKEYVKSYLAQYEPILNRVDKLIQDINKRLNGEDNVPEYTPSPYDLAVGRLKTTMKHLKKEVIRVMLRVEFEI